LIDKAIGGSIDRGETGGTGFLWRLQSLNPPSPRSRRAVEHPAIALQEEKSSLLFSLKKEKSSPPLLHQEEKSSQSLLDQEEKSSLLFSLKKDKSSRSLPHQEEKSSQSLLDQEEKSSLLFSLKKDKSSRSLPHQEEKSPRQHSSPSYGPTPEREPPRPSIAPSRRPHGMAIHLCGCYNLALLPPVGLSCEQCGLVF